MIRRSRLVLLIALGVQAVLLLPRLEQLPVWGDEQVTLNTIRAPLARALELARVEFSPPLYFLFLKAWVYLAPWPDALIGKVRLASVCLALLATVAIDRFWLQDVPPRVRNVFLVLWVLSPPMLLYARMGRSYTLQLLVAVVAIRWAVEWLRDDTPAAMWRYALAQAVLLYVHYLPGLALAGAVGLFGAYRIARGEPGRRRTLMTAVSVYGALYVPWLAPLASGIVRRIGYEPPHVAPAIVLDHALRVAYTFFAFTFGETPPLVVVVLAALLGPIVVWAIAEGLRARRWEPLVACMLPLAYLITSEHVVVSMTPSRLLFLAPFYVLTLVGGCERRPILGRIVVPGLVVASLGGALSYYRQQDFLNGGYLLPFDAIARSAADALSDDRALLVIDTSNLDATPLLAALPPSVPTFIGRGPDALGEIHARADGDALDRVWLLRSTHDISPGQWSSRLADGLSLRLRRSRRTEYVRHGALDRLVMAMLGWPDRPAYAVELLEFERPATDFSTRGSPRAPVRTLGAWREPSAPRRSSA